MTKTIRLQTNANSRDFKEIKNLDSNKIMKELLSKGYEDLILIGIPIKECADGVHLWVEQDVDFIIESCQYLEEIFLKEEEFEHYTILNDGLLEIIAKSQKEIVNVTYKFYPGLNQVNLSSYTEKVDKDKYLWWWRNITYDLLSLCVA